MTRIIFKTLDGQDLAIEAPNGTTAMENAVRNDVPGIDADCGGACACATCHVYVDEAWRERLEPMSEMEEDMLDFAHDVQPGSRLSCQIRITDALEGMVLGVPERQG